MKKLLTLGPQEIQSGVWPGVGPAAVPLWSEGINVAFKRLGVEHVRGAAAAVQFAAPVRDLAQAYIGPAQRVYAGTALGIEMATREGGLWDTTSLYEWPTAGDFADMETWGNWLVATNGVDPVVVWKNDGNVVPLANTPFTFAKVLKRKTPFLIAANTSNAPTQIEWCSDSDIETWVASAANKAGNFNIRDLDSEILAIEDIGDRLAVYSRSSMSLGSNVGGAAVWGWRRAVKGIGAISRRSVVTVDPFNYGITETGVFKTDGNSFAYVDDPATTQWYRRLADFSREASFWGFHDAALRCVTWHFLDLDSKWHSMSYFYDQNIFAQGDQALLAGAPQEVLRSPLVVNAQNAMGLWQESELFFGNPVQANIKSKPLDFGERSIRKLLQMVRVDGEWSADTRLRVWAGEQPNGPMELVMDQLLVPNNYPDFEAGYFSIEISGAQPWYVSGIEFYGSAGGLAL